jgi:hypothetical protein
MRKTILILFLSLILINCNSEYSRDLKISDKIVNDKENNLTNFKGTRIFVKKPQDYELVDNLLRIQKNPTTYIQVMEIPNSGFTNAKGQIIKNYDDAIESGKLPKEFYKKDFKINEYDAILYYGADKKNNLEQIALAFGDNEFAVIVYAIFPDNDEKTRDEILKTLLTINFDKNQKTEIENLQNFTLDLKNTEFQSAGNMSQIFVYTLDGKSNPNNVFENQIIVMVLPKADGKETLKNYSLDMIKRHKNSGIEIPEYSENEIQTKDYFGYEIYFEGKFQGKSNSVYQLVIGNENSSVAFSGIAYDRKEELMKQMKAIAKTLNIK